LELAWATPARVILAVMLVAALPACAVARAAQSSHDAQGFVGVTDTGRLVRFSDRTLPGLSRPVAVSGLRAGDAIVALDRAPSGELLALGRSSAIYALDPSTGRATEKLAPFAGPIDPGAPVTFSIAPDGETALVIAPGVDENVSLAGGAAHGDFVAQPSAGGPLTTSTAVPGALENPIRVTVAPDGSVWLAAKLGADKGREYDQSRLVRFDPAAGRVSRADGRYLPRELVALAAVGQVAVPTAPPTAQITVPTRESVRAIDAHHGIVARVRLSEGGQVVVSTRDRSGRALGFGLDSRDDAGSLTVTSMSNARDLRELRRLTGARVEIHFAVHDFAGHMRAYDRSTEIVA
jgi:hypothetical protein